MCGTRWRRGLPLAGLERSRRPGRRRQSPARPCLAGTGAEPPLSQAPLMAGPGRAPRAPEPSLRGPRPLRAGPACSGSSRPTAFSQSRGSSWSLVGTIVIVGAIWLASPPGREDRPARLLGRPHVPVRRRVSCSWQRRRPPSWCSPPPRSSSRPPPPSRSSIGKRALFSYQGVVAAGLFAASDVWFGPGPAVLVAVAWSASMLLVSLVVKVLLESSGTERHRRPRDRHPQRARPGPTAPDLAQGRRRAVDAGRGRRRAGRCRRCPQGPGLPGGHRAPPAGGRGRGSGRVPQHAHRPRRRGRTSRRPDGEGAEPSAPQTPR